MSQAPAPPPFSPEDPFKYWDYRYEIGHTVWITDKVHPVLEKNINKLNPDGKVKKILVTMCGMSVDMNWLVDQGMEVIGVDISRQAITKFVSQSGHHWTETAAPKLGAEALVFTRRDGKMKLYWGDALKFSEELEGKFDAIFDCDGLDVLDPDKRRKFAKTLQSLLSPGGRLLVQAISYDIKVLDDENFKPISPVPPPYSLTLEDIKGLFEPGCSVEVVDRNTNTLLYGEESNFFGYVIEKK